MLAPAQSYAVPLQLALAPLGLATLWLVLLMVLPLFLLPVAALCLVRVHSADLALFTDGTYVYPQELLNMQADLNTLGRTFTSFQGTSASSWDITEPIALIPELKSSPALPSAAASALRSWVSGGGTLVACGAASTRPFLSSVFGWSLSAATHSSLGSTRQTPCGIFCSGSASLAGLNAVFDVQRFTLPEGAVASYASGNSVAVWSVDYGQGAVHYFGFDWFESSASSRSAWRELLGLATVPRTTTTTSTTTATAITMTTATTTTLTLTTTVRCPRGQESVGALCTACPSGYFSEAGGRCGPLLGPLVASLPPPTLIATSEAGGVAHIEVGVSELPTVFFENVTLSYIVDMAGNASNISLLSRHCDDKWTVSPPRLTAALTFGELTGDCGLSKNTNETCIIRAGYIKIYVVMNAIAVAREWLLDIDLCFPTEAVGLYEVPLTGLSPAVLRGSSVLIKRFQAAVTLFEADFSQVKLVPVFQKDDLLHLQFDLGGVEAEVRIRQVWLSTSNDPEAAAEALLTAVPIESSPGRVRFTVTAVNCTLCFLHVLATVSDGRRLSLGTPGGLTTVQACVRVRILGGAQDSKHPPGIAQTPGTQLLLPAEFFVVQISCAALLACAVPPLLAQRFKWTQSQDSATSTGMGTGLSLCKCGFIGLLDFIFDVGAYTFCKAKGNLDIANDAGLISTLLAVSVAASGLAFLAGMAIVLSGSLRSRPLLAWLIAAHFMLGDFLQLSTYTLVATSKAAEELQDWGPPSVAVMQGLLFLVVKAFDLVGMSMHMSASVGVGVTTMHRP